MESLFISPKIITIMEIWLCFIWNNRGTTLFKIQLRISYSFSFSETNFTYITVFRETYPISCFPIIKLRISGIPLLIWIFLQTSSILLLLLNGSFVAILELINSIHSFQSTLILRDFAPSFDNKIFQLLRSSLLFSSQWIPKEHHHSHLVNKYQP